MMNRRTALALLGGGFGTLALRRTLFAASGQAPEDYFILIHAGGGWDVTLWSDPRNERRGLIDPPSPANMNPGRIKHWKNAGQSFEVLDDGNMRLGPAIGDLYELRDRLTIINGIAMNTVSHDDGTVYSATGRHRSGGIVPQPSVDVMLASERGAAKLMPDVCVRFPSFFVGGHLDSRAIPLRVSTVDALTKSFERSAAYITPHDRDAIHGLLAEEAGILAREAHGNATYDQLAQQQQVLPKVLSAGLAEAFSSRRLRTAYPTLPFNGAQAFGAVSAAFAIEAIRRDLVRCVGFNVGGLDTHTQNYREHAFTLQEAFDVIAGLVKILDAMPHPNAAGAKLSDHVHLLVISEFCRTPQINLAGGRDHYPNNSALIISPRFRAGRTFGKTDDEQLLPTPFGKFSDGERAIAPQDVIATFLGAFGIDPRRYMRDGEVVKALLV